MFRIFILFLISLPMLSSCGGSSNSSQQDMVTNDIPVIDPSTDDPNTDDPGADDPGTDDPGTDDPGTDDPGTDDPGTDDPGTDDPGTDDPGTDDPGTDDPGTDDPGTDDPGTDDPSTDDPTRDKPYGRNWDPSLYDHKTGELSSNDPVVVASGDVNTNSPLRYPGVFTREREAFGYNPRFLPGRPYFDKNNLPWIYVSNMNQLGGNDPQYPEHVNATNREPTGRQVTAITYNYRSYADQYSQSDPCQTCDGYIQRLTKEGIWVSLSVKSLAQEFGFNTAAAGVRGETYRYVEQIYFQDNGDVFFRAEHGVLHYRAASNDWQGYASTFATTWLMVGDGTKPPILIRDDANNKVFYIRELVGEGELQWRDSTVQHNLSLDIMREGHPVARLEDTLHIAAFSRDAGALNRQDHNSALYYVRFNLSNGSTDALFMGWSGSPSETGPDSHNYPVIFNDSKGYLHFISGSHNHQVWHRRSLDPVFSSTWSNDGVVWGETVSANSKFTPGPEQPMNQFASESPAQPGVDYIGELSDEYTFIHYRIDSNDTVHIVTIDNSRDGTPPQFPRFKRLVYLRGHPSGNGDYNWMNMGSLLTPNWERFSNYWHKLDMDRKGNLFLSYSYEIQNISRDQWYNEKQRLPYNDRSACVLAAVEEADCISVVEQHNSKWPDEPLRPRGINLDQPHPHDPVILSSVDGGITWRITTTNDFLTQYQDDDIQNVTGY